ncbi:MAG: 4Fe-4S binding protein [Prevotella sp.]|nr:4Fe-4S binding protein [Prevotella sp.]MCM1074646.1 4Fe-4S binding protein [Ruminococcus sp.]
MKFQRLRMFVRLLTCLLILLAAAIQRDNSILGHKLADNEPESTNESAPVRSQDGATIVNTSTLAPGVKGFAGPTPLEITIEDNKITKIEPLENAETASFFERVKAELLPKWIGTPIDEVESKKADAVSGATFSSNAVNVNIKKGVEYAIGNPPADSSSTPAEFKFSWVYICVLLTILCAAVVPMFVRNKTYRYIQLVINVIVLGVWGGTFLSYEVFVSYLANGVNLLQSLPVLIMLVIAFVYPFLGRKTHYCAWVCPLGSLQEICGKTVKYKLKMPLKVTKSLEIFQECLWLVLMFVMMAGIWFDWMGWELFTAFIFKSASIGVLIAAGIVVLLSFVVPRPYCRFICPTGCLFQTIQNPDKKL